MTHKNHRKQINEVRVKFVAPEALKDALQALANERNITLSPQKVFAARSAVQKHLHR